MQQPIMMNNPQDAYRKQGILTASPMELVLMLYDGCRKNVLKAQLAMQKGKVETAHNSLVKAQDILMELVNCLDLSLPISEQLIGVYEFMLTAVAMANIQKDPEHLNVVLEMLTELRDTWQQVSDQQRGNLSLKED